MEYETDAICVGSVLWDVIGRTNKPISRGGDVGGYTVSYTHLTLPTKA